VEGEGGMARARAGDAMAKLTEVLEELDFVTDRISTQVRTIALSVLAVAWLFLVGGKDAPVLPTSPDKAWLLRIAAVSIATLVADYLQYLFGFWATDAVRRKAEAEGATTADYDYGDLRWRVRSWLFWIKQILALTAVGGLAAVCAGALLA